MSRFRTAFRALAASPRAGSRASARVVARVSRTLEDRWAGRALLEAADRPADAVAPTRVTRRVLATLGRPTPTAGVTRLVGLAFAAVVLASLHVAVEPPIDATLAGRGTLALTPVVALRFDGSGSVVGSPTAPALRWDAGTLDVAVEPGRGVQLVVETREATVRVVGTAFEVTRSALGTRVAVAHGRVEVRCGEAAAVLLDGGEARTCEPVSAAGQLARARALPAGDEALAAVDRGLSLASDAATRHELAALRVNLLLDLGRPADAVRAADALLAAEPGVRGAEIEALVAPYRRSAP